MTDSTRPAPYWMAHEEWEDILCDEHRYVPPLPPSSLRMRFFFGLLDALGSLRAIVRRVRK